MYKHIYILNLEMRGSSHSLEYFIIMKEYSSVLIEHY